MAIQYQDSLYSWLIAVLCSSLTFLACGFPKVDSFLFVESMSYFGVNRKAASIPIFMFQIFRALAGLLGGYLGQLFGVRIVMVLGTVIFSFGLSSCFFATNILALYFLWGGIAGLGSGLATSLTSQAINIAFNKHFSKANGITVAGGPVGGLVFASIIGILLNKYGLLGTFLLLGGIMMHGIPITLMINTSVIRTKKQSGIEETLNQPIYHSKINSETETFINKFTTKQFYSVEERQSDDKTTLYSTTLIEGDFVQKSNMHKNLLQIPIDSNDIRELEKRKCSLPYENTEVPEEHILNVDIPLNKQNMQIKPPDDNPQKSSFSSFRVFLNISYHIIAFSYGCTVFHIAIYNSILVDACLDKGLSMQNSTHLVMLFYSVDFLSRLTLGWITDGGYLTRTNLAAISFFLSAISSFFFSWSTAFVALIISVALQGVAIGCLFNVSLGLVPQYIEKEYQTFAMGSAILYLVPFSAVTPTLIGFFRDELKSYSLLLYFVGSVALITCILLFLLRQIETWRKSK